MREAPSDPKVVRVVDAGAAAGVEVRPVTFENDTRTAQEAADAIGCDVAQIVKSLVFEAEGAPVLLLVSGANRVDTSRAAAELNVPELDKANADGVKRATGFSIGATPPFGHATELDILMDEDLLKFDEVWAAGGRPDTVFPVDPEALQRATGARVTKLS